MGTTSAVVSPSNLPRQLSDGNALGTILGQGPTDTVGFFQTAVANVAAGVTQPGGNGSQNNIPGTVTVYAVTVTATSVAPNTTAEQTFTVTGAAAGSFVITTKPTTNAGVAVVGTRVSALNTVGITYANATAATITPTAGETYAFNVIPANMTISATLTPAAVGPNATSTQIFTVNGIPGGAPVYVNKPTAQAGLGIIDAFVPQAGQVAITFENFTAATITPTGGQSYLFFSSPGIRIADVMYSYSATLTPVSVAANTSAEQTFTITGLPAGGQVFVNKPTTTTGLGIGGARISAANTLAINYVNNTAGAITPPSESYKIAVFPVALAAAGSSTAFNAQAGVSDHAALVALGLVAGP